MNQSRHSICPALTALVSLSWYFAGIASLPAQTKQPDDDAKRLARFDEERLRAILERAPLRRQKDETQIVVNNFYDHPAVPGVFLDHIQKSVDSDSVNGLTVDMLRFVANLKDDSHAPALLKTLDVSLQDEDNKSFSLALIWAMKDYQTADVAQKLRELTDDPDYRLNLLSADILSRHQDKVAFEKIKHYVRFEEYARQYGFRYGVLEALTRYNSPAAIDMLVRKLPELDGVLKYRVAVGLTNATNQQFGWDTNAWVNWWEQEKDNFKPLSDEEFKKRNQIKNPRLPGVTVPDFYGHDIYAQRAIFIIDHSSSMGRIIGSGQTRLGRAKMELAETVRTYRDDGYINLIFFDRDVKSWNGTLIPSTRQNKANLIRFASLIGQGNGTFISGALDAAFAADSQIEAIYLLSDGEPTVGLKPRPLLEHFTSENFFRRIEIHTIVIGKGPGKALMEELAERNYGSFTIAD